MLWYLIIIFIIIGETDTTVSSAKFSVLVMSSEDRRIDSDVIANHQNIAKLRCMSECLEDKDCELVGYHRNQRKCRRYSINLKGVGLNSYTWSAEYGWKYYAIREEYCPEGSHFRHNRVLDVCYAVIPGKRSCAEGKAECESRSANFITVDTEGKQIWVENLCKSLSVEGTFFDAFMDTEWKWTSTGQVFTYEHWGTDQPDLTNDIGDCVGMMPYYDYYWHDMDTFYTQGTICEIRRP